MGISGHHLEFLADWRCYLILVLVLSYFGRSWLNDIQRVAQLQGKSKLVALLVSYGHFLVPLPVSIYIVSLWGQWPAQSAGFLIIAIILSSLPALFIHLFCFYLSGAAFNPDSAKAATNLS